MASALMYQPSQLNNLQPLARRLRLVPTHRHLNITTMATFQPPAASSAHTLVAFLLSITRCLACGVNLSASSAKNQKPRYGHTINKADAADTAVDPDD